MSIFYIADCHFGHEAIIDLCNRPFQTVEEMDETMIENWNRRVTNKDTVCILGDMFYKHKDPKSVIDRLKGYKHFIIGNHDYDWIEQYPFGFKEFFGMAHHYDTLNDSFPGGGRVLLAHYPMLMWPNPNRSYMIHGHLHNRKEEPYWSAVRSLPNLLNAGVDINGFEPVTLPELIENNIKFKEV